MKKTALPLLLGITLTAAAQAGEDYSAKSGKVVIPPPPPPTCLWTWFAGGSVGHLDDWDEEMYTLHFGAERKCQGDQCSHALYLEVGYTEGDDVVGVSSVPGGAPSAFYDLEAEIIPITFNYKYECVLTDNLNWYVGAGAGIALVDVEVASGNSSMDYDDTVFYGHIFAGLVYNFSESFEMFGGVRYILMDDPDVSGGGGMIDPEVTLDEDFMFELGARFNF